MRAWRVWLPWAAVGLVAVGLLAVAWSRSGSDDPSARADGLAKELRCPTCQNESVFESQSATAEAIRVDIEARIAQGQSNSQIKQAYVDRYSEWVLLTPSNDGVGFVVWGLPVIVVVLGGAGVALVVWRGSRTRLVADERDDALVDEVRRHRDE